MCKAKVLTCISPEAWLRRNPSPSRSTPLDFSKCYRMCANGKEAQGAHDKVHDTTEYHARKRGRARQRPRSARQRHVARQRSWRTAEDARTATKQDTRQRLAGTAGLCRPFLARRTAKCALPGKALSCVLCHALMHDNAVAVYFVAFAVRHARTAKCCYPVMMATYTFGS
jgi:hypothetical protein